ncbi:MAG: M6 family metalloprotease domain-containing protein [Lyngbya sp.]|nr:M6 family metalloprotease domain-containing protein [Lyngbya sp.]
MVETTENLANALLQPFQSLAPVQEPRNLLTILWDPHRPDHPAPTQAAIESLLYGETNSVEDYFLENSNGQFTINNAGILGWYDADKPADHYWALDARDNNGDGEYDEVDLNGDGWISGHVEKWAEAIRKADQDFDFSAYDSNSDGYLHPDELGVLIVIPQNNPDGFVRPVVGSQVPAESLVVDGVTVPIIAEAYIGNPPHLGLVAHELSHLLLDHADMYFRFNTPFAAGEYSLMDQHGKAPHLDPFAKLKLGWVEPNIVTESGEYEITDVETSNNIWVLIDPEKGTDEYFIIENRQPGNSYDSQLSDSGLAIWHVIEDPAIYGSEIPPTPPGVNQDSWEASWNTIPAGDWGRRAIRSIKPVWNTFTNTQALWDGSDPATGYDLLSSNSDPQKATLQWADGTPSGFEIRDISSSADTMTVFIETPALMQFQLDSIQYDWIDGWNLAGIDQHFVGDFDGDSQDDVFIRSPEYAGFLTHNGTNFQLDSIQYDWIAGKPEVGGWNLAQVDQHFVGDFNNDGQDDIFIRSPEWAGLLTYNGTNFQVESIQYDWIDGWNLAAIDQHFVGDFDNDSTDDVFVRSLEWAGLLTYN